MVVCPTLQRLFKVAKLHKRFKKQHKIVNKAVDVADIQQYYQRFFSMCAAG